VSSVPGVFAGYEFDTLGTRRGLENPTNAVRLSRLGEYRNVVWLVDSKAATYPDVIGLLPMPALRYMSSPGRASTLGGYVRGGGRVWLLGGGAGTVSTEPLQPRPQRRHLGPGLQQPRGRAGPRAAALRRGPLALGGSAARWRSFRSRARRARRRSPTRRGRTRTPGVGARCTRPTTAGCRSACATATRSATPLPPTRLARQAQLYYRTSYTCEYLMEPNEVLEDVDFSPAAVHMASVVDTLMDASSLRLLRSPAPIMTWYHGFEANRFVFSGFAPWEFQRGDAIALVDFVLQDLGARPPAGGPRAGNPRGARVGGVRPAAEAGRHAAANPLGARAGGAEPPARGSGYEVRHAALTRWRTGRAGARLRA
jgi:hypothetical protein